MDRLMRTYTSEAVYLLTTLVNMARSRSCDLQAKSRDSDTESCDVAKEEEFIKTIVLEIFEVRKKNSFSRTVGTHVLGHSEIKFG